MYLNILMNQTHIEIALSLKKNNHLLNKQEVTIQKTYVSTLLHII